MASFTLTIKKIRFRRMVFFIVSFAISAIFIWTMGHVYVSQEKQYKTQLSVSVAALVSPTLLESLDGTAEDLEKRAYTELKRGLTDFREKNPTLRFAYFLGIRDGSVYFMADSEPSTSEDYSPPGQVYYEATESYKSVFFTGEPHITEPITDRWGTWITVLVPIYSSDAQRIIAVLGVDYDAKEWFSAIADQLILTAFVVVCINIIVQALYWIYQNNQYMKRIEEELRLSESAFRAIFDQASIGIAIIDGDERVENANPEFLRIAGCTLEALKSINWRVMSHSDEQAVQEAQFAELKADTIPFYTIEQLYTKPSGETIWVHMQISRYYLDDNQQNRYLCILNDVTAMKKHEEEVLYLSNRDYLTAFFNRRYFEAAKDDIDVAANLPLSFIIADINGLRLINDAFGDHEGDYFIRMTADIIRKCCSNSAVISRTGGEFRVFAPCMSSEQVQQCIVDMKAEIEAFNLENINTTRQMSVSFGYWTKEATDRSLTEVIGEAEKFMYKQKLMERKSYRSSQISSIMATLYARSEETEEHSNRLSTYCKAIGEALSLPTKNLDELELLAMLHDIGKIGIDDRILNKPGSLTEEEWNEMKKHPEIGYRIVSVVPELESIAEYILSHHERWDGKGYPYQLKGESIPLLSRILCVVDAYDAMTENRVYRRALSKEMAMAELLKNAGSQFDPHIVALFMAHLGQNVGGEAV